MAILTVLSGILGMFGWLGERRGIRLQDGLE